MSNKTYPLPYPFPSGKVWAAINNGVVVNIIYMELPAGLSFSLHRQRSRATLAKDGAVWTGGVVNRCFVPQVESTDIRYTGECNTARCPS